MGAHFNEGIPDVMQDLASIVVRYYFFKNIHGDSRNAGWMKYNFFWLARKIVFPDESAS
jgi:hypothetical protein